MRSFVTTTLFIALALSCSANAGEKKNPRILMYDSLFSAELPDGWIANEDREKFQVEIAGPQFESRLLLLPPNMYAQNQLDSYVVAVLEYLSHQLNLVIHSIDSVETNYHDFTGMRLEAVAPDPDQPTHFLQIQIHDLMFGGVPVLAAYGPIGEKDRFLAAIEPICASYRLDFWVVDDMRDRLDPWSDHVYPEQDDGAGWDEDDDDCDWNDDADEVESESESTTGTKAMRNKTPGWVGFDDDFPQSATNKAAGAGSGKPQPRQGTGRSGGARR
ncbi:MAG: hypothetical protein LIP23_03155 [Planctomycetes bacterium]|nr:hypothetical protein [Planctomycetota bacterium]